MVLWVYNQIATIFRREIDRMLYANVDGERIRATPRERGRCPVCENPVIAKCGEIYIWHWAHMPGENICEWGEETEWHREWKSLFPGEMVEIVRQKNGERRRADVLLPNGWAIEFQASPIKREVVEAREFFWDRKVMWIFHLQECEDRIRTWEKDKYTTFSWIQPRHYPLFCDYRRSVWDFGFWYFAPKKIYKKKKLTGWGYQYSHEEVIDRIRAWGKVNL